MFWWNQHETQINISRKYRMHQSSKQQIEDEDQQHKLLNFKASKVYPVNAEHNKCFNPSC